MSCVKGLFGASASSVTLDGARVTVLREIARDAAPSMYMLNQSLNSRRTASVPARFSAP